MEKAIHYRISKNVVALNPPTAMRLDGEPPLPYSRPSGASCRGETTLPSNRRDEPSTKQPHQE
jgi:hypothetical protein